MKQHLMLPAMGLIFAGFATLWIALDNNGQSRVRASDPVANPAPKSPTETAENALSENSNDVAKATLAGGCFWCTEAVFERMRGVSDVTSGYIGGQTDNPSYQAVCSGTTGHAEAVQITYDPNEVAYEDLLRVFFKTHDPTTLNRQGADVGTQYRSAIFPHDEAQDRIAKAYIEQLNQSGDFRGPIVTTIEPLSKFYFAEEYHQDYFQRNPNAGYCQAVVAQKVRKFDKEFGEEFSAK